MLKLRFNNNKHNAVWLVEPKVVIGRGNLNDLVIIDDSVAEIHAEILVDHENLTLVRRTLKGDIALNGQPIEKSAPVRAGDLITIGAVDLQVVDPKLEPRTTNKVAVDNSETSTAWALKANHTALANRVFTLKQENIVGRSSECDISLAAAHLSRRHARLDVRDGLLYVKDLGSSNGTFLNGKRITEARVKRGDDLRFDSLSFGVIGPADDMDKTSVRSLSSLAAAQVTASATSAATTTASSTTAKQRPQRKLGDSAGSKARVRQNVTQVEDVQSATGRGGMVVFLIVLAVLIGVIFALFHSGILA